MDQDGDDLTGKYGLPAGGLVGEQYPARSITTGRVALPYVVHHAQLGTGCLWDPFAWLPIVDGQLAISANWTLFGHILRNAAWAQRYTVGARRG